MTSPSLSGGQTPPNPPNDTPERPQPQDRPDETPTARNRWEERYGADPSSYLYGTEPNEFLKTTVAALPGEGAPLDVLCLADGEGRNGVHLASLGHRVTSIDLTESGMAKASRLATERGVTLTTIVGDLATYDLGTDRWDLVVSIFAHTPPPVRRAIHQAMAGALRPGGRFILEAYTPDQVGRGTGGPPSSLLTMTLDELQDDLAALTIEHSIECERPVLEGQGHSGVGCVVQLVAFKQ